MADIVAGDDQIGPGLIHAAHDQMHMRIVGVPVRDGSPVQARAKIGFHLLHQITGILLIFLALLGYLFHSRAGETIF